MTVYSDACERAGLDYRKVASITRRLRKAVKEARALNLMVFGGSGSGTLRWHGDGSEDVRDGPLIIAELGGGFDGGDGSTHPGPDGLLYGENG